MSKLMSTAILLATVSGSLAAQMPMPQSVFTGRASTVAITPYAGYISYGDLQDMPTGDRPEREGNLLVGAQAQVRMTPYLSVVGNVGFARSPWTIASGTASGNVPTSGDLDYLLADADLQVQLPYALRIGATMTPFLQGGLGVVRYTLDAGGASQSNHDLQANFGGGVDVRTGPIALRVMVKDYMTSLQWTDFRTFANVDNTRSGDARIAHNIGITAGLRVDF